MAKFAKKKEGDLPAVSTASLPDIVFMLLFFFWKMPAGVVLYWTIQNLLSVAQQIYTNTKKSDDVVPSKG